MLWHEENLTDQTKIPTPDPVNLWSGALPTWISINQVLYPTESLISLYPLSVSVQASLHLKFSVKTEYTCT